MDRLRLRRRRLAARAGKAGFTLIEVMVALGILATGLLMVAAAQVYAMRGGSTGRHTSDAAMVAYTQIENFSRLAFDDADLNQTGGAWVAAAQPQTTVVQTTPIDLVEMTYNVDWRIRDVDPNLKEIDVRVTWDEPQRPGRTLILSTALHNDPPTGG